VLSLSPFTDGYSDGLWNRPSEAHRYDAGRERAKYEDGYRVGDEDRNAGALEPAERLS
jgi:ribosome modulation factor